MIYSITEYRHSEVEKCRIAFAECVRQAIAAVDRNHYDICNRPVGVGRSWEGATKSWKPRPWDAGELRDYASEIREQIAEMADSGDMREAGIVEHENLALLTVEARLSDTQPDPDVKYGVEVIVSVLGTPLELK